MNNLETKFYESDFITLDPGQFVTISTYSRFLTLLGITGTVNNRAIYVSFNGQGKSILPVGIGLSLPPMEIFKDFTLTNVSEDTVEIFYAISMGEIRDGRFVVDGIVPVAEQGHPELEAMRVPNKMIGPFGVLGTDMTKDENQDISSKSPDFSAANPYAIVYTNDTFREIIIFNSSEYPMYWAPQYDTEDWFANFPSIASPGSGTGATSSADIDRPRSFPIKPHNTIILTTRFPIVLTGDGASTQKFNMTVNTLNGYGPLQFAV